MAINYYADVISLSPLKKDFKSTSWSSLRQDFSAAISVALLTIPQAMAAALLAGLPLSSGLFAAIYSSLIAAIFGSSRHLVVGPSNTIAILIQAGTASILFTYYRDISPPEKEAMALEILVQLSLFTALIQLAAAFFKLGRLTQFVSYSVVVGYVVGTAFAVAINQLFVILGVPDGLKVASLYHKTLYLLTHITSFQAATAVTGLGSVLLLIFLPRIDRRIPAGIFTFFLAGVLVHITGFSSHSEMTWLGDLLPFLHLNQVQLVGDAGIVYDVIPSFHMPFFDLGIMNGVLPVAFAIALFSIMETTSVAKAIATSSGQRLSVNQEIFGIGLGNFISACTGAMPISGSYSRSSVNFSDGAKTRFAAILNAVIVATGLIAFGFVISRIPLATVGALLLVSMINIINTKQVLLCLKATRSDAFVFLITFLSCIFLSLDIAFYIGVVVSITLYLKKCAVPKLAEYEIDETGDLKNLDHGSCRSPRKIRLIKVEGELFFGAADIFQTTLKTIAKDATHTKVLILQLKNARDLDATACLAIEQLYEYLKSSGKTLLICGLTPPTWDVLSHSGLCELIGKENLFMFDEHHPHLHMQKALAWAKYMVKKEEEENRLDAEAACPPIPSEQELSLSPS